MPGQTGAPPAPPAGPRVTRESGGLHRSQHAFPHQAWSCCPIWVPALGPSAFLFSWFFFFFFFFRNSFMGIGFTYCIPHPFEMKSGSVVLVDSQMAYDSHHLRKPSRALHCGSSVSCPATAPPPRQQHRPPPRQPPPPPACYLRGALCSGRLVCVESCHRVLCEGLLSQHRVSKDHMCCRGCQSW